MTWTPDSKYYIQDSTSVDFEFLKVCFLRFWFPSPGIQTPQAKIFWIPESGAWCMGHAPSLLPMESNKAAFWPRHCSVCSRRLQAVTKVKKITIREFLCDCALNASTEPDVRMQMAKFSTACENLGLTISIKTNGMSQLTPGNQHKKPSITVKGQNLNSVKNFTYLSRTLSHTTNIDVEINNRISKGSSA